VSYQCLKTLISGGFYVLAFMKLVFSDVMILSAPSIWSGMKKTISALCREGGVSRRKHAVTPSCAKCSDGEGTGWYRMIWGTTCQDWGRKGRFPRGEDF
jgi:hypothetical protein